jgi:hypothetical protein
MEDLHTHAKCPIEAVPQVSDKAITEAVYYASQVIAKNSNSTQAPRNGTVFIKQFHNSRWVADRPRSPLSLFADDPHGPNTSRTPPPPPPPNGGDCCLARARCRVSLCTEKQGSTILLSILVCAAMLICASLSVAVDLRATKH